MGQKPREDQSFWPFETGHNKPIPLLEHRPATCATLRAGKRAAWNTYPQALLEADGTPIPVHVAAGAGKQRLYLLPSRSLVVVRFAAGSFGREQYDDQVFLRTLLDL